MVMEFYQKNPSALASLRGNVYEEKIINVIKSKAKPNKKEITKVQAEKILKEANKHDHDHDHNHDVDNDKNTITSTTKKSISTKKAKTLAPKSKKVKKVSKK